MAPRSHGRGSFTPDDLAACGEGCVFEPGVLVFHPENVYVGDAVYVGHQAMLKGYYAAEMRIGSGTWIGQQCFLHAAGGLRIGEKVGIGPGVRVLTSTHREVGRAVAILDAPLDFAPVVIEDHVDLGVSAVVLPGVTIGRGALVGAGAVVTADIPPYAVAAGVPARVIRMRPEGPLAEGELGGLG